MYYDPSANFHAGTLTPGSSMYTLPPADPFQRTDPMIMGNASNEEKDVDVNEKNGLVREISGRVSVSGTRYFLPGRRLRMKTTGLMKWKRTGMKSMMGMVRKLLKSLQEFPYVLVSYH